MGRFMKKLHKMLSLALVVAMVSTMLPQGALLAYAEETTKEETVEVIEKVEEIEEAEEIEEVDATVDEEVDEKEVEETKEEEEAEEVDATVEEDGDGEEDPTISYSLKITPTNYSVSSQKTETTCDTFKATCSKTVGEEAPQEVADADVTWSVSDELEGVSINSKTGVVTIPAKVEEEETVTVTASWTPDGEDKAVTDTAKLTIHYYEVETYTITFVFEENVKSVSYESVKGGFSDTLISGYDGDSKSVVLEEGDSINFTVATGEGYVVDSVCIGDTPLEEKSGSYAITDIADDAMVVITAKPEAEVSTRKLTIRAGEGLSNLCYAVIGESAIPYTDVASVPTDKAFFVGFDVDEGYRVTSATVNGNPATPENDIMAYDYVVAAGGEDIEFVITTEEGEEPETCVVSFAMDEGVDDIYYSVNKKESLELLGDTIELNEGDEFLFHAYSIVNEEEGYLIDQVTVNGEEIEVDSYGDYSLGSISRDVEIQITTVKGKKVTLKYDNIIAYLEPLTGNCIDVKGGKNVYVKEGEDLLFAYEYDADVYDVTFQSSISQNPVIETEEEYYKYMIENVTRDMTVTITSKAKAAEKGGRFTLCADTSITYAFGTGQVVKVTDPDEELDEGVEIYELAKDLEYVDITIVGKYGEFGEFDIVDSSEFFNYTEKKDTKARTITRVYKIPAVLLVGQKAKIEAYPLGDIDVSLVKTEGVKAVSARIGNRAYPLEKDDDAYHATVNFGNTIIFTIEASDEYGLSSYSLWDTQTRDDENLIIKTVALKGNIAEIEVTPDVHSLITIETAPKYAAGLSTMPEFGEAVEIVPDKSGYDVIAGEDYQAYVCEGLGYAKLVKAMLGTTDITEQIMSVNEDGDEVVAFSVGEAEKGKKVVLAVTYEDVNTNKNVIVKYNLLVRADIKNITVNKKADGAEFKQLPGTTQSYTVAIDKGASFEDLSVYVQDFGVDTISPVEVVNGKFDVTLEPGEEEKGIYCYVGGDAGEGIPAASFTVMADTVSVGKFVPTVSYDKVATTDKVLVLKVGLPKNAVNVAGLVYDVEATLAANASADAKANMLAKAELSNISTDNLVVEIPVFEDGELGDGNPKAPVVANYDVKVTLKQVVDGDDPETKVDSVVCQSKTVKATTKVTYYNDKITFSKKSVTLLAGQSTGVAVKINDKATVREISAETDDITGLDVEMIENTMVISTSKDCEAGEYIIQVSTKGPNPLKDGATEFFKVTVKPCLKDISVETSLYGVYKPVGKDVKVQASAYDDATGKKLSAKEVVWMMDDESAAAGITVDKNGKISIPKNFVIPGGESYYEAEVIAYAIDVLGSFDSDLKDMYSCGSGIFCINSGANRIDCLTYGAIFEDDEMTPLVIEDETSILELIPGNMIGAFWTDAGCEVEATFKASGALKLDAKGNILSVKPGNASITATAADGGKYTYKKDFKILAADDVEQILLFANSSGCASFISSDADDPTTFATNAGEVLQLNVRYGYGIEGDERAYRQATISKIDGGNIIATENGIYYINLTKELVKITVNVLNQSGKAVTKTFYYKNTAYVEPAQLKATIALGKADKSLPANAAIGGAETELKYKITKLTLPDDINSEDITLGCDVDSSCYKQSKEIQKSYSTLWSVIDGDEVRLESGDDGLKFVVPVGLESRLDKGSYKFNLYLKDAGGKQISKLVPFTITVSDVKPKVTFNTAIKLNGIDDAQSVLKSAVGYDYGAGISFEYVGNYIDKGEYVDPEFENYFEIDSETGNISLKADLKESLSPEELATLTTKTWTGIFGVILTSDLGETNVEIHKITVGFKNPAYPVVFDVEASDGEEKTPFYDIYLAGYEDDELSCAEYPMIGIVLDKNESFGFVIVAHGNEPSSETILTEDKAPVVMIGSTVLEADENGLYTVSKVTKALNIQVLAP